MKTRRRFHLTAIAVATLWSAQPAHANFQQQGAYQTTWRQPNYAYQATEIDLSGGRYMYYCGGNASAPGSGDVIYRWAGGYNWTDPVVIYRSSNLGASDSSMLVLPRSSGTHTTVSTTCITNARRGLSDCGRTVGMVMLTASPKCAWR